MIFILILIRLQEVQLENLCEKKFLKFAKTYQIEK
jgi:hypothetical protein